MDVKRFQEIQKDQLVIFSLTALLAKVLHKKDLGSVLNQALRNELLYNELIILTATDQKPDIFYSSTMIEKGDHMLHSSDSCFDQCINSPEPVIFNLRNFEKKIPFPNYFINHKKSGMQMAVGFCLPLIADQKNCIFLIYKNFTEFEDRLERLLRGISTQLSVTIRNILFSEKIDTFMIANGNSEVKHTVAEDKIDKSGCKGIIGTSDVMQEIYAQISQVAPSKSNVLIYGETGTGKELIAQAIHDLSSFSPKKMIRINCAAIPANLIESELFGHEKGSFTGATEQRQGKFEQAHNSTIFLDEIGELPLELQGRLLRVLQEKEIERIGGNKRIKVNTRIIAATNRSLEKEVAEGRFRSDLFYRLNVFPIELPPLRERKEDIPLLAEYFLEKLSIKTGKKINGFSPKVMKAMTENPWPGNIRELENMIERSMLMAKDNMIKEMDFLKISAPQNTDQIFQIKTLHEMEKEYILKVVEKCHGRISGKQGAAVLLGLPSTTLISKMQKLGIQKKHYFKNNK